MNRRRLALVLALLVTGAALLISSQTAQAARAVLLTLKPNCGPVGTRTAVTLTGSGFDPNTSINLAFDGNTFQTITSDGNGRFTQGFSAPSTGAGTHTVGAHQATGGFGGQTTFTVPCAGATTTTTASTTTTTKPKTTTTTTTTTRPVLTTTTRPGTTTTKPGDTTTTTVPADTTPSTDDAGQTTTTVTIPGGKGVRLDRDASPPGGDANANGEGCDDDTAVTLSIGNDTVGHTTSDGNGKFLAALVLPDLPVGRYTLTAKCGPTLTTDLDIVLASSLGPPSGTLSVVVFFLLLGFALVRRQISADLARGNERKSAE